MNKIWLILGAFVLLLSSCADTLHYKSMTYVPLYFDTLTAVPTGDYTAEAELLFKKNVMVDKEQSKNYKQLAFSNRVTSVIIDTERKNTLRARWNAFRSKFGGIRASFKISVDPTYDLALYNLVEKYPYVDYWTNIKVDRDVVGKKKLFGAHKNTFYKNGVERVKITATGIDILSDVELENLKNLAKPDKDETPVELKPTEAKPENPKPTVKTEEVSTGSPTANKTEPAKPTETAKSNEPAKPTPSANPAAEQSNVITVNITKKGNSNIITAMVQEWESVQFEFDLEGKYTAVPTEIAAQWMKSKLINKSMFLEGEKFKAADVKFPSNKFEVPKVNIGDYTVERVQFTITDKVAKPTLGKGFFKAFKTDESYEKDNKLLLVPKKAKKKSN